MAFYSYGQQAPSSVPPPHPQLGSSPPGQMETSGYLPAYLLGSPPPKSPSRSMPASSSSGLTPRPHGPRATSGLLMDRPMVGSGRKMDPTKSSRGGGPPVQGLYDHPKSPARTSTPLYTMSPERRQLNFSLMQTANRPGAPTPATVTAHTPGGIGLHSDGRQHSSPPSPAQLDPFYSQGEALTSADDYHECWVTVFGFPPAASSYILEQFSQYGTILKHAVSSDGNWMHLLYQSRLQAKKALSKNGKVYSNGIMIGVQPCIDKATMEGYTSVSGSDPIPQSIPSSSLSGQKPSTIRPLTAAYQATSGINQVTPSQPNTPQKNTGFFSKALEYMFGW